MIPLTATLFGAPLMVVIPLAVGVVALINLLRYRRRAQAEPPTYVPLWADEEGRILIAAGWYPTPDGAQDRYHDGEGWTEQFRPRK